MNYSAPGDPAVARRAAEALQPTAVALDESWGIDHGTWSVLVHMYPNVDVPVLQLSIDSSQPPEFHYELGKRLSALRDEGVLLLGSGNVVHNLRLLQRSATAPPYDWATEFDDYTRKAIESSDHEALIHPERAGQAMPLSIPTPEHYLPMLYILGTQRADEKSEIVCDGIDLGSISMLSLRVG
jgi:4,5-DOPA dioxygenase extradiol